MKSQEEVLARIIKLQDYIANYKEDKIPQYWSNKDVAEKILKELMVIVGRCPTCGQEINK